MRPQTHLATCLTIALLGACVGASSRDADGDTEFTSLDAARDARHDAWGLADDVAPTPIDADDVTPDEVGDAEPAPDVSPYVSLRIEPPIIDIWTPIGVPASETVRAFATLGADGTEEDVTAIADWRSDSYSRASVSGDGILTISGSAPGTTEIRALLGDLAGSATVTVHLSATVVADDVTPEEVAAFDAAPAGLPEAAPVWEYPEHETVYPAGLVPPLLQWNLAGNTVVRLTVSVGDIVEIQILTRAGELRLGEALWDAVAHEFGSPISMTLQGLGSSDAGPVVNTAPHRVLYTADADLEGAVYYWQIRTGDIMEITPDTLEARPLFPDNAETGNCRGCHAITRDGGRIGFMYNGGDNPRAGLAWVTAPDPPVIANGSEFQWDWLSFGPAGLRAAAVFNGDMWLADTTPGLPGGTARLADIPQPNRDGQRATHPAWSPDGSMLAYINREPGGVDWSFGWGGLLTLPWDPDTETFGEPISLVPPGAGDQDTISYPSWSPDGRWIAYSVGPTNRGDPPATIHIVHPLTGDTTRLERGAPGGDDVLPSFSPFRQGGYYWLLFYSRRPYGHVSTNKQLWVMAIDIDHVSGIDPSAPAFWLPGQNPAETNITGYWAPEGCALEGNECKEDRDCCVGLQCLFDEDRGVETCQRVECVLPGRPCTASDVCCPGLECATSLLGRDVCQQLFFE